MNRSSCVRTSHSPHSPVVVLARRASRARFDLNVSTDSHTTHHASHLATRARAVRARGDALARDDTKNGLHPHHRPSRPRRRRARRNHRRCAHRRERPSRGDDQSSSSRRRARDPTQTVRGRPEDDTHCLHRSRGRGVVDARRTRPRAHGLDAEIERAVFERDVVSMDGLGGGARDGGWIARVRRRGGIVR